MGLVRKLSKPRERKLKIKKSYCDMRVVEVSVPQLAMYGGQILELICSCSLGSLYASGYVTPLRMCRITSQEPLHPMIYRRLHDSAPVAQVGVMWAASFMRPIMNRESGRVPTA